jgi:hypothetical protein
VGGGGGVVDHLSLGVSFRREPEPEKPLFRKVRRFFLKRSADQGKVHQRAGAFSR